LQYLQMAVLGAGTERRKLSFRALDIEQIGHVYEGLLDHAAKRGCEPMLDRVRQGGGDSGQISNARGAHRRT
jgi:hypothetical protein